MPRQSSRKSSGSGSPRKKSGARTESDAIAILKADHDKVRSLFTQYQSVGGDEQPFLAKQIFNELELHSAIEEELFYPALREQGDLKELAELEGDDDSGAVDAADLGDAEGGEEIEQTDEMEEAADDDAVVMEQDTEEEGEDLITLAYEDHKAVKELVEELKRLEPGSDQYRDRFTELREAVIDHVSEEEEVLFPEAKLKLDTKKLGEDIVKRRSDLASSMAA